MDKKILIIVIAITCVSILFAVLTFIHFDRNISYTVFYDSDGGSSVESQVIKKGGTAIKPTDPKKDDYDFVGWLLNGEEYNFDTVVTYDISLKAKWEKRVKYTVKFDTDGGSDIETQIVEAEGKVKKPKKPTKKNNQFVEWQLNGKPYDFDSIVEKDLVLTAKWKISLVKPVIKVEVNDFCGVFKNGFGYSCRYYLKLDNYKDYLYEEKNGKFDYYIDYYELFDNRGYSRKISDIEETVSYDVDCYAQEKLRVQVHSKNSNEYTQGNDILIDSKQDLTPELKLSKATDGTYFLDTFNSIGDCGFPGGLEFYEKTANGYELIGETPTNTEGGPSINVIPGESKTYVARTFLEDARSQRTYSNYTNEVVTP